MNGGYVQSAINSRLTGMTDLAGILAICLDVRSPRQSSHTARLAGGPKADMASIIRVAPESGLSGHDNIGETRAVRQNRAVRPLLIILVLLIAASIFMYFIPQSSLPMRFAADTHKSGEALSTCSGIQSFIAAKTLKEVPMFTRYGRPSGSTFIGHGSKLTIHQNFRGSAI